jgi:hypothetical protein
MEETYFIKISGKANIPERLEVDKNYHVACDCSITQESKDSNENGTYDITFKAQPMTVEILKSNGKIIKARDPRKNSQKMRNYLWKIYTDEGYCEDFDLVYDTFAYEVMGMTPSILKSVIKRLNDK